MRRADALRLSGLRLASQRIVGSEFTTPAQAAEWMLASQAQDLGSARWALGVRSPASTISDVDEAFNTGRLVRSWPFRGTLHVTDARDLGWMLELSAARTVRGARGRHAQLGLDQPSFDRAADVASNVLRGGAQLSRAELFAEFDAAGLQTAGGRGGHILWYLSHVGLVCLGPLSATGQAVVLTSEWIGDPRQYSRPESLTQLALRYFSSRGPATLADLLSWSKLLVPEATAGLAGARDRLREIVIEQTSYFVAAELPEQPPAAHSGLVLLPGFDEYLLGYRDRDAVLAEQHREHVVPGGNGIFLPMIVSGGQIVGTWKRGASRRALSIETRPFIGLSKAQQGRLRRAASAYARFVGADPRTVTIDGAQPPSTP